MDHTSALCRRSARAGARPSCPTPSPSAATRPRSCGRSRRRSSSSAPSTRAGASSVSTTAPSTRRRCTRAKPTSQARCALRRALTELPPLALSHPRKPSHALVHLAAPSAALPRPLAPSLGPGGLRAQGDGLAPDPTADDCFPGAPSKRDTMRPRRSTTAAADYRRLPSCATAWH